MLAAALLAAAKAVVAPVVLAAALLAAAKAVVAAVVLAAAAALPATFLPSVESFGPHPKIGTMDSGAAALAVALAVVAVRDRGKLMLSCHPFVQEDTTSSPNVVAAVPLAVAADAAVVGLLFPGWPEAKGASPPLNCLLAAASPLLLLLLWHLLMPWYRSRGFAACCLPAGSFCDDAKSNS